MKLGLDIKTQLTQKLTPQQIQYLKLLQMPVIQMEQHIKQEIDENPMIEEVADLDEFDTPDTVEESAPDTMEYDVKDNEFDESDDKKAPETQIDDDKDPFEFYNMVWQDDSEYKPVSKQSSEDDDEPIPIKANESFVEELNSQLQLLPLKKEHYILGTHIIGNIDDDGYLRRELPEITDEANSVIADYNFQIQKSMYDIQSKLKQENYKNPAYAYALSDESKLLLEKAEYLTNNESKNINKNGKFNLEDELLDPVSYEDSEKVLKVVQSLDPPGIASRNIKECLLAQCKAIQNPTPIQKLGSEIIEKTYDAFIKKHYNVMQKYFDIDSEELKKALEFIKTLNPKPGGGDFSHETNTVIPDFVIERDKETEELLITLNDNRMPKLKLNQAYEKLRNEAKQNKFNKDTKNWIRAKHEDAKFLIQAIRQRKNTMLKVMTAIAHLQRDFFDLGSAGLKPLIYKDVAEKTALDISTVCRIVNGKYVQTDFGTFELKYFFSEALPNLDGEEISTTVIKERLKEIIDGEPKSKPYSDDKISKMLKESGYKVARRTVAKYREQLNLPVARLRKEI